MRRMTVNDMLVGLTLVHLGQQLGCKTELSAAVFDLISSVLVLLARISHVSA